MKTENEEEASYLGCIYFHLYEGNLPIIKPNELSEKFKTALDPLPPSFLHNCLADFWGNLQYNFLDQKLLLPFLNFFKKFICFAERGLS